MSAPNDLVAGRSCGDCTVCCSALAIETRALRKVPGVACVHCGPQGCAIYGTRYPVCRAYHCGWRQLPELDDAWRPDRSRVLVSPAGADGIEFLVLGGEAAIRRDGFARFLAACIRSGVTTFLAVPGPPGSYSARVRLDERLAAAAGADDLDAIRTALCGALSAAAKHGFRAMEQGL